jgi:predicted RNA polymerase sigma factor
MMPLSVLPVSNEIQTYVAQVFQRDHRRVFATLVRQLGGFDIAEEALQDAFRAALEHWRTQGLPKNPVTWLVSTGRFKAIDKLRREQCWTSAAPCARQKQNPRCSHSLSNTRCQRLIAATGPYPVVKRKSRFGEIIFSHCRKTLVPFDY